MKVNAYLNFNGNCREAFNFYAKCLGGKIEMLMDHTNMPPSADTPPNWGDKVLHVSMSVGDSVLMGSDAPPEFYQAPQGMSVSLGYTDVKEAERVFNALAAGGQVRMPFAKTFWAQRFGITVDRFGIPWMIGCE